ncbi:MAG: hypothetical protein J5582_01130 [Ruminococcus sp.]|uniref:hypothetical protein n=1 Tax=Ruminococcus sp. TaxID=41978 RepID=UPI0025F77C91|nr:hypothetical protein [Ruminococcus sp.]MBO4865159.1 hypothetical protein [Ruminococcus sp.]
MIIIFGDIIFIIIGIIVFVSAITSSAILNELSYKLSSIVAIIVCFLVLVFILYISIKYLKILKWKGILLGVLFLVRTYPLIQAVYKAFYSLGDPIENENFFSFLIYGAGIIFGFMWYVLVTLFYCAIYLIIEFIVMIPLGTELVTDILDFDDIYEYELESKSLINLRIIISNILSLLITYICFFVL